MAFRAWNPVVRSILFAAVAFVPIACDAHDHAHPHPDEHADEHAAEHALARLGERYLVHLIHPNVARGTPATMLVHGTRLDTGEALHEGAVDVSLRGPSGATVRGNAVEESSGRWRVTLTLADVGAWHVAVEVRSGNGSETVDVGELVVAADAAAAARVEATEAPAGAISFPMESQWSHAMRFERVAPRAFREHFEAPGRIEAQPGARAHAAAPVAGLLATPLDGSLPRPGDRVVAGQVMARVETYLSTSDLVGLQALEYQQHQLRHELDLQQLEAERNLSTARVRIQAATREVERATRLLAGTLGTQAELDAVRADLDLARADESAALASLASVNRLRNEHAEDPGLVAPAFDVRAPISGIVDEVSVARGESVEAGERIATIVDLGSMWAVAEVPEHELGRLASVDAARVSPRGVAVALDVAAAPTHVGLTVDPTTRSVDVAFSVPNEDRALRVGMLATFELYSAMRTDALTVPESAIVRERGRAVVYVLLDGETFVKRRVRLGARDADRHQVLEGLVAGDVIVVTDVEELRLAALAGSGRIVEHQH